VRKIWKRSATLLGVSILAMGAYLGLLQINGNFHEILPGELYRSAQPTPQQLADYINRYGIKTVINLRGPSQRGWYKDEVATAERLAAQHVDFQMSVRRQLTPTKVSD
jgi:protein tyrosine/serine phosphatase